MQSLDEIFFESYGGVICYGLCLLYCLLVAIVITAQAAYDQKPMRLAIGRMRNAIGAMWTSWEAVDDAEGSSTACPKHTFGSCVNDCVREIQPVPTHIRMADVSEQNHSCPEDTNSDEGSVDEGGQVVFDVWSEGFEIISACGLPEIILKDLPRNLLDFVSLNDVEQFEDWAVKTVQDCDFYTCMRTDSRPLKFEAADENRRLHLSTKRAWLVVPFLEELPAVTLPITLKFDKLKVKERREAHMDRQTSTSSTFFSLASIPEEPEETVEEDEIAKG
eukprot:gnl/TRDRNA2_/TRDRNA2_176259_c2_seq3.p1 gnl/TRDRNA2_/TRDRNA2_176259_c2~~gnl/TRDRNA2_/TRDRNA2_176259_c2_seq3.p1  ORF type:complete len:276 (-),score=34.23 gnl/TRDRNA2_/TRDRNA2_176259_c2_seq3:159-986(-)